jgi:hypothetical protein
MKNIILLLPALMLVVLSSCEKDPPPLDLERFDVRWYDDDGSETQNIEDALGFDIVINTTDPDPDDQFITEWEFSYTVNNQFGGILQGDEGIHSNTLSFRADVLMNNLPNPGPGILEEGDVVEFRLWCIDNFGTEIQQFHRFVLEE